MGNQYGWPYSVTYLLVLTFVWGVGTSGEHDYWKSCTNMACVEKVRAEARQSPYCTRIRVFGSDLPPGVSSVSGMTAFPALIDEWLS